MAKKDCFSSNCCAFEYNRVDLQYNIKYVDGYRRSSLSTADVE